MKIMVLTSSRRDIASRALPTLHNNPNLEIVRVVLAHGATPKKKRLWKRKIKKLLRIGLLGALNGIRIRSWYQDQAAADVGDVCRSLAVEIVETDFINTDLTRELLRECRADLGLSLSNGYIAKSVFSIPRHGMINVHGEILPQFRGAQSIIWPIYEGLAETGFTIHQIDRRIDAGDVLFQKRLPIVFHSTLKKTVVANLARVRLQIPATLSSVCEHYPQLRAQAVKQEGGISYTTPTFRQFLRMLRNHNRMYKESR